VTQEVLPGGYWLTPVLFEDLVPARPSTQAPTPEVNANGPTQIPLFASGVRPTVTPAVRPRCAATPTDSLPKRRVAGI
jgi:hypothetical protein